MIAELRLLLRLGWPMMTAQLAQMCMGVMDTIMAGHASSVDQAGVAMGGNVLWPSMLLVSGVLMAVPPTVSQLRGGGRDSEVGEVVRQAFWLMLCGAAFIVLVTRNAGAVYTAIGSDPAAADVATRYLGALSWGLPGLMSFFLLRYLCDGLGMTRPAMVVIIGALLLKLPLNYVLVFGNASLGIPAFGGVGCGIAMAILYWLQLAAMLLIVTRPPISHVRLFAGFSAPDAAQLRTLLVLGVPIGLTIFFEMALFSVVGLLVSRLGAEAMASHQIAMNIGGLTFMIPLALGQAATIRVGFNVGARDFEAARRSAHVAMAASLCFAVCAAALVLVLREPVAALFNPDPAVIAIAAQLLLFVAVYQLFDDAQATAVGTLRGFKDTRVPMLITLACYWLAGLPVAAALGLGWLGWHGGLFGFWAGLTLGLGLAAAALGARLWWVAGHDAVIEGLSGIIAPSPVAAGLRTARSGAK